MYRFIVGFTLGMLLAAGGASIAHDESKVPFYRYKNKTSATIYNDTFWSAKLKVKCDWDGKRWRYVKMYPLKGHSKAEIVVPNGSRCQVWPSLW